MMTQDKRLCELAQIVASSCGYEVVPPMVFRRGRGGDWRPRQGIIRVGREELKCKDRLWGVVAHELAHAQASEAEGHSIAFWRRLAEGLRRAGRLELLRLEVGYREGALRVAREFGLSNLPEVQPFHFLLGERIETEDGNSWRVRRRFRIGGQPAYRLSSRRWLWTVSESILAAKLAGGIAR